MNGFSRFMMGRYGLDTLSFAILIVYLLLEVTAQIFRFSWLAVIALLLLALAFFRMLSRNITARQGENERFLKFWSPVHSRIKRWGSRMRDAKTHRYYKCPGCGNTLRVPRGRGKIEITCPVCRHSFIKKS